MLKPICPIARMPLALGALFGVTGTLLGWLLATRLSGANGPLLAWHSWEATQNALLTGVASAAAALGTGWWTSRFWERAVGSIAASARRIAEGDYSVRLDGIGSGLVAPEVRGLCNAVHTLLRVREQQARDLRETLRHFHGTFENLAVGVFHLTRTGSFRRINQRFCTILGHSRESLLRTSIRELLANPDEDRAFIEGRLRALFSGQIDCFTAERRLLHHSGKTIWIQLTASLMRDENGAPECAICFAEDVSTRRHAEEQLLRSEASMRSLLDCSRDSCLAVLDLEGRILSLDPSGRRLLRLPPQDNNVGERWAAFWDVPETEAIETAFQLARVGRVGRFCGHRADPEASRVWWEVTITAIPGPEGLPERLLSVARDVTLQHSTLEALQQAKESAEAASRAKDDFLSALSHELRTPLNPVLLLAGEYARSPDVPAHMREDFALIHRNVRLEARLIDDLLDLTKIQRAGLSVSARLLDLRGLLAQVCEAVRSDATEKKVRLVMVRPESPCMVRGDTTRLHQIFANLILNAVKFSEPGMEVRVEMHFETACVRVSIQDQGIGITAEELGRIFEPFTQGIHARESHRFGGLGLGLAIAKMLVERHRGRVWADSPGRGHGANFHVELPIEKSDLSEAGVAAPSPPHPPLATGPSQAPAPALPPPSPNSPPLLAPPLGRGVRSRKILLVEDHEPTRATLSRMLGRRGHTVTQAASLGAASVLAKETVFDVLISDIGLPDGNGGELIRQFADRFLEGGIALSGFGMEAEVARSLNAGFKRHLTKPIEVETLEETLNVLGSLGNGSPLNAFEPGPEPTPLPTRIAV
jgi:PAS domain S-box-containing protein